MSSSHVFTSSASSLAEKAASLIDGSCLRAIMYSFVIRTQVDYIWKLPNIFFN